MKQRCIVIALIYSGRPDPNWELSDEQCEHFFSYWNDAKASVNEVKQSTVSGYRGIRIVTPERSYLIYDEIITCFEKTGRVSRKDEQRKIEIYFLNSAPKEIALMLAKANVPK
jgi:hypothetical protein